MALHIIKLVVGVDSVEGLMAWQKARGGADWRVHTRMTPRRAEEVLDGGSIYRVFKGVITCRQSILGIETHGEGQARRCQIIVSPQVVRVAPTPRRAFQGWRYLAPDDAPPDLEAGSDLEAVPTALAAELRSLGAW